MRSILRHTITATHLGRADLVHLLRQHFGKEHLITEHADKIEVDDIIFRVQDDQIIDVRFLDEDDLLKR